MFDVYSEINVPYILKYFMYVPVVTTNNQLLSRNLISHQALIPPPPPPPPPISTLALKMDFHIKGFLRNRSDYYSDIRNEKNRYLSFKWCNFKTNKIVCVKI